MTTIARVRVIRAAILPNGQDAARHAQASVVFALSPISIDMSTMKQVEDFLSSFSELMRWPAIVQSTSKLPVTLTSSVTGSTKSATLRLDGSKIGSILPRLWSTLMTEDRQTYTEPTTLAAEKKAVALRSQEFLIHAAKQFAQEAKGAKLSAATFTATPKRTSLVESPSKVSEFLQQQKNASDKLKSHSDNQSFHPTLARYRATTAGGGLAFDQLTASFCQYPALLRSVGLVIDGTLDVPIATLAQYDRICVALPSDLVSNLYQVCPVMRYETSLSTGRFAATSRGTMVGGYYNTTGLKIRSLNPVREGLRFEKGDGRSQRYLTSGIAVYDPARPDTLAAQIKRQQGLRDRVNAYLQGSIGVTPLAYPFAGDGSDDFFAEDVLQGYQIDVSPSSGTWKSLCDRTVRFALGKDDHEIEDTAWVDPSVSVAGDDADQPGLQDIIFRWEGWSLAGPQPGNPVPAPTTAAPSNSPLSVKVRVRKGSLPRLEFGETYTFRLRSCDLAGNSPDFTADVPDRSKCLTQPMTFLRYEALEPPTSSQQDELLPMGEGPQRLVVRDTERTHARRFLLPPPSSVQMAQLHGQIDLRDFRGSYNLLASVQGTIQGVFDGRNRLNYLCDPLITTLVLTSVPGLDEPLLLPLTWGSGGEWPFSIGWWLELRRSSEERAPDVIEGERTVRIYITPAAFKQLYVYSDTDRQGRSLLAAYQVGHADIATPDPPAVASPRKVIDLIYAVHKPLLAPTLAAVTNDDPNPFSIKRNPHDSKACLTAAVQLSGASTSKVALDAAWSERVDDGSDEAAQKGFVIKPLGGAVGDVLLKASDGSTVSDHQKLTYTQTFADTKYRSVTYTMRASTSFGDFIAADQLEQTVSIAGDFPVPSSKAPEAPDIAFAMPTIGWSRTGNNPRVSSRSGGGVRVWMRRPWFSSGDGEQIAVAVADDPNSANPQLGLCSQLGADLIWSAGGSKYDVHCVGATEIVIDGVRYYVHDVTYDSSRQQWYADITVRRPSLDKNDAGPEVPAYMPFLKLGLARFQSQSINPVSSVSQIRVANLVQLLPDRTATIIKSVGILDTTVSVTIGAPQSAAGTSSDATDTLWEVCLERTDRDDSLAWERVATWNANKVGVYSGTYPTIHFGTHYRVAIREYEKHPVMGRPNAKDGQRVVYIDTINL